MIGRPCKPDADLKGLWRTLLGTPFPACGMPEVAAEAAHDGDAERGGKSPSQSAPHVAD
jgi:hypothetical protein